MVTPSSKASVSYLIGEIDKWRYEIDAAKVEKIYLKTVTIKRRIGKKDFRPAPMRVIARVVINRYGSYWQEKS